MGALNWCSLGNWREPCSGPGWEGLCLCQGGARAALLRALVPTGQSKEERAPPALVPPAPASPSPGTLWGALGQPPVAARQGRQDLGRGLLPAAPDPGDAAASQGGDPGQGPRGCPHPPSTPLALGGAGHGLSSGPVRTDIYICTRVCSAALRAHPALRDGDTEPPRCASHAPTPAHGTRHTNTPPAVLPLCHSLRFGTVEGRGWVTGVPPPHTGWGRADRCPHPGSGPALPCISPPDPAPSCGVGRGARHRCDPARVAREGRREGRVGPCSHSTPTSPGLHSAAPMA